jgi:hypothetical protein
MLLCAAEMTISPRARHYLERADYHAELEAHHRARATGVEREGRKGGPVTGLGGWLGEYEEESRLANHHGLLEGQYRRAAYVFWEQPPAGLPLPYPWNRDRDRRVYEALAKCLIDDAMNPENPRDECPANPVVVMDRVTTDGFLESWGEEDLSDLILPRRHVDAFRRNDEGPIPLAEIGVFSSRVVIDDLDKLSFDVMNKHQSGVAFIRVSLPGYTRDGNTAVVAVSIAFDQHGSGEMFVLASSNGQWRVVDRELVLKE